MPKYSRVSLDELRYLIAPLSDSCILWARGLTAMGYALLPKHLGTTLGHRIAWQLTHGPIAPGTMICHTCDTRRCINPRHLFCGTQRDNMRDMAAKGRHPRSGMSFERSYAIVNGEQVTALELLRHLIRKPSADCIMWPGYLNPLGYARIAANRKHRPGHQLAWEIHHDRPFPIGMMGRHSCHNRACVNPLHIKPGTAADNGADRANKWKVRSGLKPIPIKEWERPLGWLWDRK